VLESGKRPPTQLFPVEEEKRELEQGVPEKEKKANPYNNLLVLRRIEL